MTARLRDLVEKAREYDPMNWRLTEADRAYYALQDDLSTEAVLALLDVVDAAREFRDDCPIGDDDQPYVTEICNGKEWRALKAAITRLDKIGVLNEIPSR